jgi:hypothetical protein
MIVEGPLARFGINESYLMSIPIQLVSKAKDLDLLTHFN